jgi:hypothetical protein
MRGSALRAFGRAVTPRAPRGLAGGIHPRAPRPKGALLPCGNPAPDISHSGTLGSRVRPLRIRARGALLPETPARKGACPLSAYPRVRCRR